MVFLHYLSDRALDKYVYFSFDRSSPTGFKYSSSRANLLTVLRVAYADVGGGYFTSLRARASSREPRAASREPLFASLKRLPLKNPKTGIMP